MNITLKQVRAFLAVAQTGSFTAAAGRLALTQSAVSVLVAELERPFGLRLFDRTTRQVHLTDAGRDFLPVAEKVLADLNGAVHNSRETAERRRGRVALAATPLMSSILLPEAIAGFAAEHPGIRVELHDTLAGQILSKVRDGVVDFGIGTFERPGPDLDAQPLMTDTLVLACPSAHALAARSRVPWRELAGHPFIALTRDNSVGQLIRDSLAGAGVELQPAFEVAYLGTVVGMVDAGLGVAVLPSYARPITRLNRIALRPLVEPSIRRETAILTRHRRGLSPAAQSLVLYLAAYVKRTRRSTRL